LKLERNIMRLLKSIWWVGLAGALLVWAPGACAQAKQPTPPPPAKKAPAAAQKAAQQVEGPAAPKAAPQAKPAEPSTEAAGADLQVGTRRDPFASLIGGRTTQDRPETVCRAPGKGGIVVETMVVDGIARSASAVIAVVRTPQQRVYFLREGDRLCDGRVERITLEGLTLRQTSRDVFGKPIERIVSKRIFPSAGE
jgi:Tfp pilus assembly protein PilP